MPLPRLAITMGDAAGIGPEVIRKALLSQEVHRLCQPLVIGDLRLFPQGFLGRTRFFRPFLNFPVAGLEKIVPGRHSAVTGRAAYQWIRQAVELAQRKEVDGIVTAPLSKEALRRAGIRYPGHTELLADLTRTKHFCMLMVSGPLRSAMVTRHIPLRDVSAHLSVKDIVATTTLTADFLCSKMRIKKPRVGVCSLNPHAGEGGLLGSEEKEIIIPALRKLSRQGFDVAGPLPVDSAWLKMKEGKFDLLVAMYHDQTMTGLKCLEASKIVNITVGLPFIRTSPGHGTGFDIAGRDIADPRPMIEALRVAALLAKGRQ